jgi:hypothetical protein
LDETSTTLFAVPLFAARGDINDSIAVKVSGATNIESPSNALLKYRVEVSGIYNFSPRSSRNR